MSYPLSTVALDRFGVAASNLSTGVNKISIAAYSGAIQTFLSGFEAVFTNNAPPSQLAKDPNSININDSIFIKRIRLNSTYRFFQNVVFGGDDGAFFSYIGVSRDLAGTQALALKTVRVKFYEWMDVNLMLPFKATPYIYIQVPAFAAWYNLPTEYATIQPVIKDTPFIELEFAHSYPIVLAP